MAEITDDTQMTLFTAEGLIRARIRLASRGICDPPSVVHHAYLRWLTTQGRQPKVATERDGWLYRVRALHANRAPGNTCLSALQSANRFGEMATNDSKGCGGVMRVAPCGWWPGNVNARFDLGAQCARLTHGHPSGYLAAGYFAALMGELFDGHRLLDALAAADSVLAGQDGHAETTAAVGAARAAAQHGPSRETLATLGEGWVAEEALAIALYCVLAEPDPVDAVVLAVNHDGDSDSTGALAGQMLGALHGRRWIPTAWLERLELRAEMERLALDLAWSGVGEHPLWEDYPGW